MRLAISTHSLNMVRSGLGWTTGLRLVSEVTGGPGKGDSILEGSPEQFEELYDTMNMLSRRLALEAVRLRAGIDSKRARGVGRSDTRSGGA